MSADRELADEAILGPLVSGRTCGECVACCRIPEINAPELNKPAGVLCPHCSGTNCRIYERRPSACRAYYCLWRRIGALPDHLRPDRINVMFGLVRARPAPNLLTRLYIRGAALDSWDDFRSPGAAEAIAILRRGRLPVWLSCGDTISLAHPSNEIAEVLLDGAKPATPRIAAEAAEWFRIHSQF